MAKNKELTTAIVDELFPNVDILFPNVDILFPNVDELFPNVDILFPNVDILFPEMDVLREDADTFNKKYILKPSATIAIEGKISAPARKLFNILYAHAFDTAEASKHVIALPTIMKALDGTLANFDRLKEHLKELANITLEWDILGKDGRVWGVASLLSFAEIRDDVSELRYALAEQLKEPDRRLPYARLSVKQQNSINSSHAMTLYENLTDFYYEQLGKGETGWIPLPLYQRLLGTNYTAWRDIQKRLIQEPISKLNNLDFSIEVQQQKRGRKVVAVKFIMTRKPAKEISKTSPKQLSQHGTTTFAQLRISQLYRIVGGTPQVFVKTSDTTAQNLETKKPVTMQNVDVAVELLSNRKP